MATKKESYTGADIQVLEGLEPVRKRPAMYIGGTDSTGYHHLLWEILDNSVDEVINGYASFVEVTIHKDGLGLRFALEGHTEVSTRSGRKYAKTGEGDEIIGVQRAGEKDLLAVLTEKTSALVCKVNEVNELQGPGKGVMVIKVEESDRVVEFLAVPPGQKDKAIEFETQKGRKLSLHPAKYEVTGRGGKGHEMSRKDAVKEVVRPVTFIPLPEQKKD